MVMRSSSGVRVSHICDKVNDVADDTKQPAGRSPEDQRPSEQQLLSLRDFVQLALDATITGPRMRTEDLYEPATELKIKGERGTFIYKHASLSQAGLVSLHLAGDYRFRAVRPDQVTMVRKARSRK